MATEYRCFGPPGTGKTTWLAKQVHGALRKYDGARIFCASFTRAAATELAGRGLPLPRRNIGTIHSLCFHAGNCPKITETSASLVKEWNEAHHTCPITGTVALDEPFKDNEDFLMHYNRLRNTFKPIPARLAGIVQKWEAFKADTGTVDFTDLLLSAPASIGADVLFVDEFQDLTPLQLRVVRRWGEEAETFITAGDDDQVLYEFIGASAAEFQKPLPEDHIRVLHQSYRLPRRIYEAAEKWIAWLKDRRQPKTYQPRDDDGKVDRRTFASTQLGSMIAEIADKARGGGKVMVLASCGYMLQHLLHELREAGIPFHNPYRRNRGDWNPLRHTAKRVTAFLQCGRALRESLPLPPYSTWWEWVEMIKAGALEGRAPKKRFKALLDYGARDAQEGQGDDWNEFLEHGAEETASAALGPLAAVIGTRDQQGIVAAHKGDLAWLSQNATGRFADAVKYPCQVIRKQGPEALEKTPGIIVGTIHSVKGGESGDVYIFPDLSYKANRALSEQPQQARDALTRMVYVGITRARKNLHLLQPSGQFSWEW